MSAISIICSGGMAAAIAGRTAKAEHTVEVVSRAPANARALADQLAAGATTGTYGAAPAGDIVILAVPYTSAAAVVADYGDALDGKVIIDITNPISPDTTGLVAPAGSSFSSAETAGRNLFFVEKGSNVIGRNHHHRTNLVGGQTTARLVRRRVPMPTHARGPSGNTVRPVIVALRRKWD